MNNKTKYKVYYSSVIKIKSIIYFWSILDEEGIKLFAFHGQLNEEMDGREGGTYSRDILKPKNGRWTFVDKSTKLKKGDILYYWTYVDYFDGKNKLGYTNDFQKFVVEGKIIKCECLS